VTGAGSDVKEASRLHYRGCSLCEAWCGLEIRCVNGPRGTADSLAAQASAGGWQRVGWDDALDRIAARGARQ
jgi:anaerobic selenocysteine-containing dehydrogenase